MSPVNVSSIGSFIRQQREQARISIRQLAQAAGVSNPYLSQLERGLRKPSADILQQLAKGLRISAEALYAQAGMLEDRPEGTGVRDAVLADAELTERQKQVLIELYESFRKELAAAAGEGTAAGKEAAAAGEGTAAGKEAAAAGEGAAAAAREGTAAAGEEAPGGAIAGAGGQDPGRAETDASREPDRLVPSPASNR
jgi:transcriptional regulator with XRE-family HTH domain